MSKVVSWSDDMLSYLRANAGAVCSDDMARHLGISPTTVRLKCGKMGLPVYTGNLRRVEWSEEMLCYLREHYADTSASDIADYLGISGTTVSNKARELGLRKSDSFSTKGYYKRYVRNYVHNEGRAVS